MLNRDQQRLLGALGAGTVADALLDRIRDRGTFEGGRSAPQPGCWINYNRKTVRLEDHSEIYATLRAAGTESATEGTQPWRRMKPTVVVKVTWAEAAAYGASLPPDLRDELAQLVRAERDENRTWWDYSNERGGWPHRRRFSSDDEHQIVQADWDTVYGKHIIALSDLRDRQKAAIARALPLIQDDEPADLLELLDHQPEPLPAATPSPALQASALHARAPARRPTSTVEEDLFASPETAPKLSP